MATVGIVIVSHSSKVAEGAADMVRQMVGDSVKLAYAGGDPDGNLGTDVAKILAAIDQAWSAAGVAILVDLGGAETNSEMAIEMLEADRRDRVVICNAPIAEGAAFARAGAPVPRPALGIMVEVPAAAIAIDRFDAAFFSIGSNDLTQYVTAAGRDMATVAELSPNSPILATRRCCG